ncbi:hypothetical protein FALCPG4_016045 [Fusarium falciforme]
MSLHVCYSSPLWHKLVLQLGHHDEAIKRTLMALGAAYQTYKAAEGTAANNWDCPQFPLPGAGAEQVAYLETLTTEQYNKALLKLRQQITEQPRENIEVALICCLMFVSFENVRFNSPGAIAHLANGLRIIASELDLDYYCGSVVPQANPPKACKSAGRRLSSADLMDLVRQFRRCEICACAFSTGFEPVIALRLYKKSRLDDGSITYASHFTRLIAAHAAVCSYTSDVYARSWETRHYAGDTAFWSSPLVQREHQCLRERGLRIADKYKLFMSSEHGPRQGTADYFCGYLDIWHLKCTQAMFERMPYRNNDTTNLEGLGISDESESLFKEIVHFAGMLQKASNQSPQNTSHSRDFNMDLGIAAPVYFAYANSRDSGVKSEALGILEEMYQREGYWDAKFSIKLIRRLIRTNKNQTPFPGGADLIGGTSSIPHPDGMPSCLDAGDLVSLPSCFVLRFPNPGDH